MGVRLEFVLSLIVISLVSVALTFKLDNSNAKKNTFTKELEIKDATLIEVNQEQILGKSFTKSIVSDNKILILKDLTYFADNIEYIQANIAKLDGYMLYLEGNIKVKEKNGYLYETEQAIFNQKSKILNITTPFYATMGENRLEGKRLLYDLKNKKLYARDIKTRFTTSKK